MITLIAIGAGRHPRRCGPGVRRHHARPAPCTANAGQRRRSCRLRRRRQTAYAAWTSAPRDRGPVGTSGSDSTPSRSAAASALRAPFAQSRKEAEVVTVPAAPSRRSRLRIRGPRRRRQDRRHDLEMEIVGRVARRDTRTTPAHCQALQGIKASLITPEARPRASAKRSHIRRIWGGGAVNRRKIIARYPIAAISSSRRSLESSSLPC
jgi:hypothetical protein